MSGPVKVDVLVVGSGAAGLSAAVTAAMHGASVMVAEKASVLGGTSAWSGGWLWIPRNPLARAEGIDEAADAPLTYLQHEMGGEAADIRLQTFLRYGPEMVEFFHQRTAVQFLSGSAMPDFHPSPGAANGGRSVTAQPYDGRLLGDWLHRLRPPLETISLGGMGIAGGADMAHFFNATRSPRSALYAARRLLRHGWQRLRAGRGQHLVNGNALVARLLRSALDAGDAGAGAAEREAPLHPHPVDLPAKCAHLRPDAADPRQNPRLYGDSPWRSLIFRIYRLHSARRRRSPPPVSVSTPGKPSA